MNPKPAVHTPTLPVKLAHYEGGLLDGVNTLKDADGFDICHFETSEKGKANAAFIVRAVNCHNDLLNLARWVNESFKDDEKPFGLSDLLAKAEGRS